MSDEEFEKLVFEGIEKIPERFRKHIDNVAFVIEDEPSSQQKAQMHIDSQHMLLGLYQGIAQTRRGENYNAVLPDKITIFKRPIMEVCNNDPERIKQQVYDTVWHEIGHHFGLNEEEVRKREVQRRAQRNKESGPSAA